MKIDEKQRAFLARLDRLVGEAPETAGKALETIDEVSGRIRENVIRVFERMYGVYCKAVWGGEGPATILKLDRSLPREEQVAAAFAAFVDEQRQQWKARMDKDERFGRETEARKTAVQLAALDEVWTAWTAFVSEEGGKA